MAAGPGALHAAPHPLLLIPQTPALLKPPNSPFPSLRNSKVKVTDSFHSGFSKCNINAFGSPLNFTHDDCAFGKQK